MRRTGLLGALAALGLAGCGGGTTTTTVTVTRTVTTPAAPAPAPTSSAPAGTDTTATTTSPEAAATPLPAGVVGADGTYRMHTRKADFTGENITVDDEFPSDSEWVFRTACHGDRCSLRMRRELGSGAFKSVTLDADPARPNVFVGETSGTTGCANAQRSPTKQRYSVRLTAPEDVGGRRTARRMDVYFTETARGCSLSTVARGVVSWRGNRTG